jgi:hypothetical protein
MKKFKEFISELTEVESDKFKVGDKVQITDKEESEHVGHKGEIVKIDDEGVHVKMTHDGPAIAFCPLCLKKI